ncbi:MAG: hypothetical protein FWB96_13410 [Defluviitaleaceae bacterium]|nr:hypothetical protein [Defluviitaleaceae bacterium]MCL2264320.1 hypothetical protein [Defluviitaleaceae bacterium]
MLFPKFKVRRRFAKPAVHSDGGAVFMGYKAEQQVIARFLDAVMANSDDAWAFVSKVYSPGLDLNELREMLGVCAKIRASKAFYMNDTKNCMTRSVYVENPVLNLQRLLHLRMVKDGGAWKIYGVEQEECKKKL